MIDPARVGYALLSHPAVAKKASKANLIGGEVRSQRKGCVAEEMPRRLVPEVKERHCHYGL